MPSFHDFRFLSTDGKHNVFARECTPDGEVRAVLQIAHGVAEHIYRYAPFMEFLAENGFVVVANDHLGHGKTAENEQELCFFAEKDGWNDVVSDMDTLHKLTAAKYPGVPYFLFGHCMGSFLTRTDIIDQCKARLAGLSEFAPEEMSEDAIRAVIREVIAGLGIENPTGRDKGKIMKELMPKVKGKADGSLVNKLVGELLA